MSAPEPITTIAIRSTEEHSVSRGYEAPRRFVVGRLIDAFEQRNSVAPGGVYPTSAKSRSVPGQSVKTGSSPALMRHLFGGISDEGLAVAVAASTSPPQCGTAPCA